MFGGLTKTASRMALVAAAGTLMTGSAFAADLGGDCCADLEERVAELEATTARKGNRKVSLTISGQVNRAATYWADGGRSNMQFGDDNHNSSTRFGFAGSAKISPNYSAGFSMVLDVADKARTSTFSQATDIGGSKFNNGSRNGDDQAIRLRDANWWIESSSLGRVTLGRMTTEGALGTIDLAGIGAAVGDDIGCNGGGLAFRDKATGLLSGRSIGNTSEGGCVGPWGNRAEGIKYTSPTFAGFVFVGGLTRNLKVETTSVDSTAGAVAPRGHELFAALRYAGEFSGVRVAASAGYTLEDNARDTGGIYYSQPDGLQALGGTTGVIGAGTSGTTKLLDVSLSLMHVATGLFATGNYSKISYDSVNPANFFNPVLNPNIGSRDASRFRIVAGISQNWFGLGKTALYGEYARHENFAYATTGYTITGCAAQTATQTCSFAAASATNLQATAAANTRLSGDAVRTWGLGMNQAVDAAAMDLYINYRNHSLTDPGTTAAAGVSASSISVVTTGARIRF
jgi:hypothetical protein